MNRRLGPGIWTDDQNQLHFSIPELLDVFGWPHDAKHEVRVRDVIREVVESRYPGIQAVEVDACPHCGLEGLGVHGIGCPYRRAERR